MSRRKHPIGQGRKTPDGTRILRDRITALHALGYNHAQIARVLCRTRQCISWNARALGLERVTA